MTTIDNKPLFKPIPPEPKREAFADWRAYRAALVPWLNECVHIATAQLARMQANKKA